MQQTSFARLALVLGILMAIGPVAIDMYLPALPTIAADLATNEGTAQLSLALFFVALAMGQPIYGPLSDRFGRKRPIYAGLALFTVATLASAFVTSIDQLIVLRFFQGLGVAAAMTLVRAVIRDRYTGPDAARLFSLIMLVLGVSPVLAPLAGSGIVAVAPWKWIFAVMAVVGAIGIAVLSFLPETLPAERRNHGGFRKGLADYWLLLRDKRFMGLTLLTGTAQGGFFAYISGSSFFFISAYGLEPWVYSLVFAANAIGMIGLMQFVAPLMRRYGGDRLVWFGVAANAAAATALLAATLAGVATLAVVIPLLFVTCCTFPMILAPASVAALDAHGERAGTASALMGTLQFSCGAIGGVLFSAFFDGTTLPLVAIMAGGALLSLLLTWLTFRRGSADVKAADTAMIDEAMEVAPAE